MGQAVAVVDVALGVVPTGAATAVDVLDARVTAVVVDVDVDVLVDVDVDVGATVVNRGTVVTVVGDDVVVDEAVTSARTWVTGQRESPPDCTSPNTTMAAAVTANQSPCRSPSCDLRREPTATPCLATSVGTRAVRRP